MTVTVDPRLLSAVVNLSSEQVEATRALVLLNNWRNGTLEFKLHATQQLILSKLRSQAYPKFFLLCSRRLGKTYMLWALADMAARRKPGARILYLAPWAKDAASIAKDTAAQYLIDCPAKLKPHYNAQDKEFIYPNGSIIRLKGTNGEHAQFLRGGAADLVILDECGQMDDLKHVVSDVCAPMTLTTGGQIILASTPPRSPGHESAALFEDLAGKDAVAVFTLRDAPHITEDAKAIALAEAGENPEHAYEILAGTRQPTSTTTKREYFCQFVTDANSAVVKEYTDEARLQILVPHKRPPYFDAYVAMDPGMRDRTGILFGYWDFVQGKLVIEDEILLQGPGTPEIAKAVKEKENDLWGAREPYMRITDVDLRLKQDLYTLHNLDFRTVKNKDALGEIGLVRYMVQGRMLVIDPRCTNLDRQLRNATWNSKSTDFENMGTESVEGHYDLLAALKYLCRAIDKAHNPYPDNWFGIGGPGGLPANTYVSVKKRRRPGGLGLMADTPVGRKLAKRKR